MNTCCSIASLVTQSFQMGNSQQITMDCSEEEPMNDL